MYECSATEPRLDIGSVLPPLNAGQIYTTLSRLERDGLVDDDPVSQNGRPNKRV